MEKLFAALIVVSILILIPAMFSGLLRKANLSLWLIPLRKRIGSVPKQIYIPKAVKFGLNPLGYFAIIVLIIGLVFMLLGGEHRPFSDTPILTSLGRILAVIPMIYLGLLLLDWLWKLTSASQNPIKKKEELEREQQERSSNIKILTQLIDEKQEKSAMRLGYFHLWRVSYVIDVIDNCLLDNSQIDESLIILVKDDIQTIVNSPETDTKLLKQTKKKQRYFDRVLKIIKKK